jgi:hypothetical protein
MMEIVKIKFKPHEKQKIVMNSSARFRILSAGRRFGKSFLAGAIAVKYSLELPGRIVWIVAPVFSQTKRLWRVIMELLPAKLIKNVNRSELMIETINGSTIWFKSGDNPDSLRGEGIDFLVVDEASRVKREAWEQALRPALSDKKGSALFISTPNSFNWFHELFSRGQLPEEKEFESWQFPTVDSPFIDFKEVEEAKRTLPQMIFAQEYLAQFIDEAGSVFRGVNNCIIGELEEPIEDKVYVMGVDLAKHQDFTVIIVMDKNSKRIVAFQRFNQISWPFQKKKIEATSKKFNDAEIMLDSTGVGDPIFDDLSKQGLRVKSFKFTNESKTNLIEDLAISIEQRELNFPNIPELVNELHSYGYESTPSGKLKYGAPSGLHDDCVIALALAWKAQKGSGFVFDFV